MTAATPAFLAIVNPAAGNGAGKRLAPVLAERFRAAGMHIEVLVTPGPGEAAGLASEAAGDGYDAVIAVGGDGTANEVANGPIGTPRRFGAPSHRQRERSRRGLGYPGRSAAIPRFLASARPRVIDVGEVNGRIFVNDRGTHANGTTIRAIRARTLSIELDRPMPVAVDGEILRAASITIGIRPRALTVLAA